MPTLYVVTTPIGNLGDLSPRAREALAASRRIFAEDTRRTRALLSYAGIAGKTLVRVDAHATEERVGRLVQGMDATESAALVTDAGVPGVSDPGAALVRAAAEHGVRVVPIPGPSALTTAVAASGLVEGPFFFLGFLPRQGKKRRLALERVNATAEPVVLFEAPQRIAETLAELAETMPARRAVLCRELTKLHEEIVRGTAADLASKYANEEARGEIVLVVGAAPAPEGLDPAAVQAVRTLVEAGARTKTAAKVVSDLTGAPANALYREVAT